MSEEVKPSTREGAINRTSIPLILFILLAGALGVALFAGNPENIPSPLVGKPVPAFKLPPLQGLMKDQAPVPGVQSSDLMGGKVSLFNIWASWCAPCRQEHPILTKLAQLADVPLYGLNYKDNAQDALTFLKDLGNPYTAIGRDDNGIVGIEWGVYGIPETFVINHKGQIVYKHVGPITPKIAKQKLLPMLKTLKKQAASVSQ